jgi:hypothetical protein
MDSASSIQEQAHKPLSENKDNSEPRLVDVPVTNENMALNLLVSFVHLAQRRGAFNIDESAKIYECIKKFQRN